MEPFVTNNINGLKPFKCCCLYLLSLWDIDQLDVSKQDKETEHLKTNLNKCGNQPVSRLTLKSRAREARVGQQSDSAASRLAEKLLQFSCYNLTLSMLRKALEKKLTTCGDLSRSYLSRIFCISLFHF